MKQALILKKLGMSQVIDSSGVVYSVTILQNVETKVLELKTTDKHNYDALVIGFSSAKDKSLNKSMKGYFNKKKSSFFKSIQELRFSSDIQLDKENLDNNSSLLDFEAFKEKEKVSFKGKSKGKGFQGTIKAHGFSRGPMSHGSKNHRLPGSIGAGTDPARVFKGTKMGKRCGDSQVTIKNLSIVKVDSENKLLFVNGSVPGNPDEFLLMYK